MSPCSAKSLVGGHLTAAKRKQQTFQRPRKWHRVHGRPSIRDKAVKQQLLTPAEERAVVQYALRQAQNGYPLPAKSLSALATVLLQRRNPALEQGDVRTPGINWARSFLKRHPELKARRLKAVDWKRHDHNIYDKTKEWFETIGAELQSPVVLQENVYNMDETGVLLSSPKSLRVLVGKNDFNRYRGAAVQRTLITAIECISADGRCLNPLIVWPAATLRSNWMTHETPGWHFACSESGYTNSSINLYWIKNVFDPATRARADGKPRILISDGFAPHESAEVMTFCFENNIVLCRLPSHTSHKLQPCDVGCFAPLKTAYREYVEQLLRGGANAIGKQHFTLLYDRGRQVAMTARNVRSGWSKAGLWPFNPQRVLGGMSKPQEVHVTCVSTNQSEMPNQPDEGENCPPGHTSSLNALKSRVEAYLKYGKDDSKRLFDEILNVTEEIAADRCLMYDEIRLLKQQNNEKKVRQAVRPTVLGEGKGKVFSWDDVVYARERQLQKSSRKRAQAQRRTVTKPTESNSPRKRKSAVDEIAKAKHEIAAAGLAQFCDVF